MGRAKEGSQQKEKSTEAAAAAAAPEPEPDGVRRVGIIFAGGPAPGANAVISAAAISFLDDGREVVGFRDGYQHLAAYDPFSHRLKRGAHYVEFGLGDVTGLRNSRGVILGTSRTNPGKAIEKVEDLDDPEKTEGLRNVYFALHDRGIDALISIGGDDTLRTANLLHEYQKRLPKEAKRIKVIHLPKTIDNDYRGIDFTFGYFTAVDALALEVSNLRADAASTSSWFVAEVMGRKSGWLAYGVGIAGEANMIVSVEDLTEGMTKLEKGEKGERRVLDPDVLAGRIVDLMLQRERTIGKSFGTVVLAEGLAEHLPTDYIRNIRRDEFGHISLGKLNLAAIMAEHIRLLYEKRTGKSRKVTGIQLGYEARCARAHAFDVMLGSQLGIGAYKALVEKGKDGHMVSVMGQLDLTYVPFGELVDPKTLVTENRFIERGSNFWELARFLEDRTERVEG